MTTINTSLAAKRAHRRYYHDTYACTHKTTVLQVGEDIHGIYFIPQETIFHPQGGGQPADEGYIEIDGLKVPICTLQATEAEGFIKHYYLPANNIPPIAIGEQITMVIDRNKRLLFAAYHTAGHLMAHLLEKVYPTLQGIKGNHFPGQGAVVFIEKTKIGKPVLQEDYASYDLAEIKATLTAQIATYQKKGAKVKIDNSALKRTMQIGSLTPFPCGGTHLTHTNTLQDFQITKVAFKKKEGIKISYTAAPL